MINKIKYLAGIDVQIKRACCYYIINEKKNSKTRFEIGINLKGQEPKGKLEAINTTNAMCSNKINLSDTSDIDK